MATVLTVSVRWQYEAACQASWNAVAADQRPIGFLYCMSTNDVVHAVPAASPHAASKCQQRNDVLTNHSLSRQVNFARKNHPHVVVRYNEADNRASCDGALVLDLTKMKTARVWPCDSVGPAHRAQPSTLGLARLLAPYLARVS